MQLVMQICSQWFVIHILSISVDIHIYLYPQKFTDIRKYLSAVPYPRTSGQHTQKYNRGLQQFCAVNKHK